MSDEGTIRELLSGNRRTLHVFYQTYAPKLLRLIQAKIDNPGDAEEVLQDTLFAFLEALRDFQGKSSIQTFLYSIANHKIIDFYRRKKMKHIVFSRIPQLEAFISPLLDPEEEFDETMLRQKINDALGKLLPHYRRILLLKYGDNLSVVEIARKLAITFKSAESQIFRARKAFIEVFLST